MQGKSSSAAHIIQERVETEFLPKVTQVLTNVRSINKTDVITLLDAFGSVRNICHADEHQLVLCPGIGSSDFYHYHYHYLLYLHRLVS